MTSELGLGVSFVASRGQDVVTEGVHAALAAGIDYFDTAPYYSAGADEAMLGHALRGMRQRVTLATKVGYIEAPDAHRNPDALMRQLNDSLRRLQTDYVDVLQIHEADFRKWWTDGPIGAEEAMIPTAPLIEDGEAYDFAHAPVMAFLARARASGKARCVGFTAKDARRAARLVESLAPDTVMIAHQFNPVLRNASALLFPVTAARETGVLVGAPLMRGWLARPKDAWRTDPPAWMDRIFQRAYVACLDIAAQSGLDLAEMSIRWMLGEKRQHALVFGFRTAGEIAANVRAASQPPLPAAVHEAIAAAGIVHPLLFQGRTTL